MCSIFALEPSKCHDLLLLEGTDGIEWSRSWVFGGIILSISHYEYTQNLVAHNIYLNVKVVIFKFCVAKNEKLQAYIT